MVKDFWHRIINRRKQDVPVSIDRRVGKTKMRDADKMLRDAIQDLEQTVRLKREDFLKREVANDIQHQVQFVTFRDICSFSGSKELAIRLCRNPKHEAANTGIATCEETLCPLLREITAMDAA